MHLFLAGGSGALGRQLVPLLVAGGHRVVALTRTSEGAALLSAMGATPVIGDVFDRQLLDAAVARAEPEIVIHQLTAFGAPPSASGGSGDPLAAIRVRTEGTRNLVEAARRGGARRFIAQSISFVCTPVASGLTDEETPLYLDAPPAIRPLVQSIADLENQTIHESGLEGVVLRYGWFYGPGTSFAADGAIPRAIRKGRMPLVGEGRGTYSLVNVRDAALATRTALTRAAPGIYNVVDDVPVQLSTWLPVVARLLAAPPPGSMTVDQAREKLGEFVVYIYDQQSGASNRKIKTALGWEPTIPSWEAGFQSLAGD